MSKKYELDTSHPMGKTEPLEYPAIESQIKFLQGKVLTIIDASYQNERQLRAVKDLVNKMFSDQMTYVYELCHPEVGEVMTRDKAESIIDDIDAIEAQATTIN